MEQQEQIFQLYMQYLADSLSAEEAAYVNDRLISDEAFRAAWEKLDARGKAMDIRSRMADVDAPAALQAVKAQFTPVRKVLPIRRIAAAAAVLLLAGAGALFIWKRPESATKPTLATIQAGKQPIRLQLANGEQLSLDDSSRKTITLQNATLNAQQGSLSYASEDTSMNTLLVPAGENYKLALSDGTEVWLNAASKLTFPFHFGKGQRKVHVEGEAYFKVAKNAAQPFVVSTPHADVLVLGTAFNINTYSAGTVNTALVEGSVIARSGTKEVRLLPGQAADFNTEKGFTTGGFDEEEVLAWLNGVHYYHQCPLPQLVETASRFYGVTIHLDKKKYAGVAVTGLMDRNHLEEFLSDLKTTARITYRLDNNELWLQ